VSGWLAALAAVLAMASPTVTAPPAAVPADYQLGGAYAPSPDVQAVTRDRTERPAPGIYSICYVNSFQTQPGSLGWWTRNHPELLLRDRTRHLVRDPGWPDEALLDIRTSSNRAAIAQINRSWFGGCARAGFAGVEPDNLDSWTRSRGLLKKAHAVDLAKRLVRESHRSGLAIAQKNSPELGRLGLGFDFAVAEECEVYRECDAYTAVYGRNVIEIEYSDTGRAAYARSCAARAGQIAIMLRDRDVVPAGSPGYVHRTC
jgi:hypothetical protein